MAGGTDIENVLVALVAPCLVGTLVVVVEKIWPGHPYAFNFVSCIVCSFMYLILCALLFHYDFEFEDLNEEVSRDHGSKPGDGHSDTFLPSLPLKY